MQSVKFSNPEMGLSMAASWAWGVSLAVSYAILQEKGLIPYFIWAICNIIALLSFGLFILRYPAYLGWMDNRIVKVFMLIIQIFSIWINIKVLAAYTSVSIAMLFALLLCVAVYKWGFIFSVKSDVTQYILMVLGLIIIILIGIMMGTFDNKYSLLLSDSYVLWAIFGGIGLLSGPFLDMQQLQRAAANPHLNTFIYASGFFGMYMLLVFASSYFISGIGKWLVAILLSISVIGITTSTIDSAFAALNKIVNKRNATIIALIAICSWWLVKTPSVTDFWYIYATLRVYIVIPMILMVVIKWQWINKIKGNSYFLQKLKSIRTIFQKRC